MTGGDNLPIQREKTSFRIDAQRCSVPSCVMTCDLFASIPKLRDRPKIDSTLVVSGNKAVPAASDPLLHFQQ